MSRNGVSILNCKLTVVWSAMERTSPFSSVGLLQIFESPDVKNMRTDPAENELFFAN